MRYKTELTEQIITSKNAEEMLNMVAPVYGNDYVSLWLFQANGYLVDKVENLIEDFVAQIIPQTATWSLPMWESEYGIVTNTKLTIEQRRQNIINKMWSNGAMNPARLGVILGNVAGVDVTIKERTGKRMFTIYISSRPHVVDESAVRKMANVLKPGHLLYDIKYQNAVASDVYVGGAIQKYKNITLREV